MKSQSEKVYIEKARNLKTIGKINLNLSIRQAVEQFRDNMTRQNRMMKIKRIFDI